jgi:hypothetical protein
MENKLSKKIVYMKMNAGEGTSNPGPYKPFFRKLSPYKAIELS